MAYCYNCGSPLKPESKFCQECGTANALVPPVPQVNTEATPPAVPQTTTEVEAPIKEGRIQEFSGKITKCPNCGEVLKALARYREAEARRTCRTY